MSILSLEKPLGLLVSLGGIITLIVGATLWVVGLVNSVETQVTDLSQVVSVNQERVINLGANVDQHALRLDRHETGLQAIRESVVTNNAVNNAFVDTLKEISVNQKEITTTLGEIQSNNAKLEERLNNIQDDVRALKKKNNI